MANEDFTFTEPKKEPFLPEQSQFRASKAPGPAIAPSDEGFSFNEAPIVQQKSDAYQAGQRSMQEKALGLTPESQKQVLSFTSGVGDTAFMGFQPWMEALGAKGLSYVVPPKVHAYFAGKSEDPKYIEDVRERQKRLQSIPTKELVEFSRGASEQAQQEYPKTALAGQTTGLVGSAMTLPVVAPKAGAFISGVGTGSLYGGISGLSENLDPLDAVRNAVVGGIAGGTLGPLAEKALGGFSRIVSSGKNLLDDNGFLTQEATEIAKKAGMTNSEILMLAPQLAASFKKYGMRPESATMARFEEFGITPTQGMVTKDPVQLAKESEFAQPSYGRVQQQAKEASEDLTGTSLMPREAVDIAHQAVQEKAAAAKNIADKAYSDAAEMGGYFPVKDITGVGKKIAFDLNKSSNLASVSTNPLVTETLKRLDDQLGKEKPIYEPFVPGGPPVTTVHNDFRAVEEGRVVLNQALTAAISSGDNVNVRAINTVIDKFDSYIENKLTQGAFSGDPNVLNKWKEARSLWSEYKTKFGVQRSGDESGKLLKQIIDDGKSPDDVGRMIFNYAAVTGDASMKVTALKTISQLNRALGPNSPEMQGIKSSFVNSLMSVADATPKGFNNTANRIDDFIKGRGAGIANNLLSRQERAVLDRFSKVMRDAGSLSENQLQKEVSIIAETAKLSAPSLLSGMSYALGMLHPVLATMMGVAGYAPQIVKGIQGTEYFASKAANAPFTGKGLLPPVPGVRVATPNLVYQNPDFENAMEEANKIIENKTGVPMERASGGRTMSKNPTAKAMALIAMADRIKKEQGKDTSSLLNLDDTTVAKALAVANRGI
jgi:hypothetical protein